MSMDSAIIQRLFKDIWAKTDGLCYYCGADLTKTESHTDYIIARSKGGETILANLVPACVRCNRLKRSMTLEEFRLRLSRGDAPLFTSEHIDYLKKIGVTLPPHFLCFPRFIFWFEREKPTRFPYPFLRIRHT